MAEGAIIARITNVRKHPNADRLTLATVLGNQVVVALNNQEGELGVFFPCDLQLSEEFTNENDLVERKLPDGSRAGGFFDHKRRVKVKKFRGEKSDGFWIPIQSLAWTRENLEALTEGTTFTELNGYPICEKYITKATRIAGGGNGVHSRRRGETKWFPKHKDTKQFRYYADTIPAGTIITLSEKLHGTSQRKGHVLDVVELSRWKQYINRFRAIFPTQEWTTLNGTRNVILEKTTGPGFYGTNDFREDVASSICPRKGEMIYFEVVGFLPTGTPIMPAPGLDKKLQAEFGCTNMLYKYGSLPGTCTAYVYRITQISEEGYERDLSQYQMAARCWELGLKMVPIIQGPFVHDGDAEKLRELVEWHTEKGAGQGRSYLDHSHISEGVVLRCEMIGGETVFYKNKSFLFRDLEGLIKDDEKTVDMEEAA